ncbi:hypothetical protein [Rossellomorea marisflavi]|uniref:hypothetical protein n=1 Tax=Rossellomorea marisflavi TaxID=189381 RepID=UPI003F9EE2F0
MIAIVFTTFHLSAFFIIISVFVLGEQYRLSIVVENDLTLSYVPLKKPNLLLCASSRNHIGGKRAIGKQDLHESTFCSAYQDSYRAPTLMLPIE